jgi:peptide/nickel transport system permease protein
MMRLLDALIAIPRILLLIAVLALWGELGLPALVLLLGFTGWFGVSRLVRAEVLALRERDFVSAARALGGSDARILVVHLLPSALAPVVVASTLAVGDVIVLEAGLSYLGIGVRPPWPSWGNIAHDGVSQLGTHWWLAVFPGLAIVATVLACNVLGDALRDALDPHRLPGE